MKKSRFSEEKIIALLKQAEAGVKMAELARKHGVSEAIGRSTSTGMRRATKPITSDSTEIGVQP